MHVYTLVKGFKWRSHGAWSGGKLQLGVINMFTHLENAFCPIYAPFRATSDEAFRIRSWGWKTGMLGNAVKKLWEVGEFQAGEANSTNPNP